MLLQVVFLRTASRASADQSCTPYTITTQVDEMELGAKRLKERCQCLLNGASKYRNALTVMLEAQTTFAAALNEFGGGTDEESLHLGTLDTAGGWG